MDRILFDVIRGSRDFYTFSLLNEQSREMYTSELA